MNNLWHITDKHHDYGFYYGSIHKIALSINTKYLLQFTPAPINYPTEVARTSAIITSTFDSQEELNYFYFPSTTVIATLINSNNYEISLTPREQKKKAAIEKLTKEEREFLGIKPYTIN